VLLIVTKKTMLAAAVATGVAATGVGYYTEAIAPAAESTSVAPLVASIPSSAAFATPNRLLEAVTGEAASSTDVAPEAANAGVLPLVGRSAGPAAQSRPAVPQSVVPKASALSRTPAVTGDGPAPLAAVAGPGGNPIGIFGAVFAVFVSNGDEPGENGGLLFGNGADAGEGQNGGRGGLLMGNGGNGGLGGPGATGGEGGQGTGTTGSLHGGTGKPGQDG
jgi:hypothetical protein